MHTAPSRQWSLLHLFLLPQVPPSQLHSLSNYLSDHPHTIGQAGYAPPPPGSGPSYTYANADWQAHGADPGAPPRTGGPFGGYSKERDFYKWVGTRGRFALFVWALPDRMHNSLKGKLRGKGPGPLTPDVK